jgi:hypothetical protein
MCFETDVCDIPMAYEAMFIANYSDKRGAQIEVIAEPTWLPDLPVKGRRYCTPQWRKIMLRQRLVRTYQMVGPKGLLP